KHVGTKYQLKGWQMLKKENADIIVKDKKVETDYAFAAYCDSIEVKIPFTFKASPPGGKPFVTIEDLYDLSKPEKPIKVTEHKDIEDDEQTVTIKEVPETPTPEEPEKPTTPDTPTKSYSPNTGDNTNILSLAIMMFVSAGGLAGTY
ncbi:VaFE repeat-containing surface-anchored protein, partial [Clostridioides difficile]|uniref:VaFE repeat-containing surface-anchored protein n=1 Tax=Clostridioides difficile TaxID=1496 RepID=UPI0013040B9F